MKQRIKCINNDNGGLSLTIGRIYDLEFIDEYGNYNVVNDDGVIRKFWKGRFKTN